MRDKETEKFGVGGGIRWQKKGVKKIEARLAQR